MMLWTQKVQPNKTYFFENLISGKYGKKNKEKFIDSFLNKEMIEYRKYNSVRPRCLYYYLLNQIRIIAACSVVNPDQLNQFFRKNIADEISVYRQPLIYADESITIRDCMLNIIRLKKFFCLVLSMLRTCDQSKRTWKLYKKDFSLIWDIYPFSFTFQENTFEKLIQASNWPDNAKTFTLKLVREPNSEEFLAKNLATYEKQLVEKPEWNVLCNDYMAQPI